MPNNHREEDDGAGAGLESASGDGERPPLRSLGITDTRTDRTAGSRVTGRNRDPMRPSRYRLPRRGFRLRANSDPRSNREFRVKLLFNLIRFDLFISPVSVAARHRQFSNSRIDGKRRRPLQSKRSFLLRRIRAGEKQ